MTLPVTSSPDSPLPIIDFAPLPYGWRWLKLGELAAAGKYSIKRGPFGGHLKKETFVSSGYKVYEQGNAIKNDFKVGNYYISEQKYKELEAFKVQTGDVIISCSGTIGKVAVVTDDAEPGIINQALLKIGLNHDLISPQFFKIVFESHIVKKQLKKLSSGSGLENVASVSLLKQISFPLPDVPEQERIVAILTEQMAALEQTRAAAESQLKAASALSIAYFRELFDNSEVKKCKKRKLVEVSTRISKGESPGWQGFEYSKTGARFIRSENVTWGALSDEPRIFIPLEFHEKLSRSKLRGGDVLINLVGASIGRACVVPQSFEAANVNQAVAVVSPSEEISAHYLVAFVISPQTQKHFQEVQVEMARPNISLKNLRDLEVPLPKIESQRQLSSHILKQVNSAEVLRNSLVEQLNTIKVLPALLLRQAFTGKL